MVIRMVLRMHMHMHGYTHTPRCIDICIYTITCLLGRLEHGLAGRRRAGRSVIS